MSALQPIPFPRDESGQPVAAEIFLQPIAAPSVIGPIWLCWTNVYRRRTYGSLVRRTIE
jgi:small neutral amino acid transporter SnatA (MarC family)